MYFGPMEDPTPYMTLPGDTMMVGVKVTIKGHTKQCLLPVMDHRNKAIKSPDAFAVNTAMMRCLAKAIAMHGLGLYIYAGEDLPEGDDKKDDKKDVPHSGPALAFAELQPEIQQKLRQIAQHVVATMPNVERAIGLIEMACDEWPDNDLIKPGLWSLLDSGTRSAIKRHQAEKEAA